MTQKRNGAPGTTEQRPRWEGPPENRPRGYLPAVDDPETAPDATEENPDRLIQRKETKPDGAQ